MATYGSWYLTAEDATQTVAADTAEKVDVATTVGPIANMTHATPNKVTNDDTTSGVFQINATATISHDTNNTLIHLLLYVDGAEVSDWEQERKVGTGGDIGNMSVSALVTLAAASYVELYVSANKSGDLTWNHLALVAHKVTV